MLSLSLCSSQQWEVWGLEGKQVCVIISTSLVSRLRFRDLLTVDTVSEEPTEALEAFQTVQDCPGVLCFHHGVALK